MSIDKKEVEKLVLGFPEAEERFLFESGTPECDDSYVDHNLEAAVWLLENSGLLFKVLVAYLKTILEEGE
jgi:hypothetical protein